MTDQELLQIYTNLVPFLSEVCGPGCEIVVHDVTDPDHSIIAIRNSLSGRELGDPMTNLAKDVMEQGTYSDQDYMAGYAAQTKDGVFASATYFIKNQGRLIGMLCINKDTGSIRALESSFRGMLDRFGLSLPQSSEITESLDTPVADMMNARIADIIAESGIPVARMSMAEKVKTVQRLNEQGVMMMKGAAAEIGRQLNVSIPTVYRYLKNNQE